MRRALLMLGFSLAVLIAGVDPVAAKQGSKATSQLTGWAPSKEQLIDRLLQALAHKDAKAMEGIRVNQDEFVGVILPGSVAEGQPLRKWPRDVSEYFFRDLNTKSIYSQQALLETFGGRTLKVESVEYEKGVKRYANHVAFRQLRLKVRDDAGTEALLATGSIAEFDGKFKFISFLAD